MMSDRVKGLVRRVLSSAFGAVVLSVTVSACEFVKDLPIPTDAEVATFYTSPGIRATVSGNVATVTVIQPAEYLRQGGSLWAKSTPYLYMFSQPTQLLFYQYEGLAGVRIVSQLPSGEEVARVLLRRDALNGITWGHALLVSAKAMQQGTQSPQKLRDLVEYGEARTEFSYNPKYAPSRKQG
jgi:hypothetical protein